MFQSPTSGAVASTESFTPAPRREEVRHILIGPARGVERTILILHTFGYADPNDWSKTIPLGEGAPALTAQEEQTAQAALAALFGLQPGDVVRVLTKRLILE